jgi:hypothetical protein
MKVWWSPLRNGTYPDDGFNSGVGAGDGLWTISQPLPYTVWMAGMPVIDYDVAAPRRANLVADVYDVPPDGNAILMSRGAKLLRNGDESGSLALYGQDWPLAAGHRVAVMLSGSNIDWWYAVPTNGTVTVRRARLGLPALTNDRTAFLSSSVTPRMTAYAEQYRLAISPATIQSAAAAFVLPPPLAGVVPTPVVKAANASRVLPVTGGAPPVSLVIAMAALVAALSIAVTTRRSSSPPSAGRTSAGPTRRP